MKNIRVLVCDDHQIVRQGIRQILADAGDVQVMGEAATGPEAITLVRQGLARQAGPDVVLLDIAMPQRDGLDILKALKSEFARLPVLVLSTYPDRQYAVSARATHPASSGRISARRPVANDAAAVPRSARRAALATGSAHP